MISPPSPPRLFLLVLFLNGAGVACLAQQNLFNVPTSDITGQKKLFYQQQLNFTSNFIQFNTTLSYGIGKNMEVGLNAIGINLNTESSGPLFLTNGDPKVNPQYPFYTLNFQKAFPFSKAFKLAIGTQTGVSAGTNFGSYIYSNFVTILPRIKTKFITGLYWGSNSFLGPEERNLLFSTGSDVGTQIGIEQPILKEKIFLIAENISGKHSLGETSLGGAWKFSRLWFFSAAYQFPNYSGTSTEALVLEFTYVP